MILVEIEYIVYGEKYKATICEHIKEVFELALKYELDFVPDYFHDNVECSKCNAGASIDVIQEWLSKS